MLSDQHMWCQEENFIVFNYASAAIDREDPGVDYEIPETKPFTRLLIYLAMNQAC